MKEISNNSSKPMTYTELELAKRKKIRRAVLNRLCDLSDYEDKINKLIDKRNEKAAEIHREQMR